MNLATEACYRARGHSFIAGIDEVGRGALAGPVVAAAVILPANAEPIPQGIRDSKLLSRKRREVLFPKILSCCIAYGVGFASRLEVDHFNILRASLLAMQRAVGALQRLPDLLLIDGRDRIDSPIVQVPIIGGDRTCMSIAAASIVAKVTRDRLMCDLALEYPRFGFAQHMGYATVQHRQALAQFGPCFEHRRSYLKGSKDADAYN